MATRADLSRLWWVVLSSLLVKIAKGRPSAELLFEARKFMVQSGYVGPVHTPKVQRQLDKLHAAYLEALRAAVGSERPSSSALHECRLFLLQTKAEREQTQSAAHLTSIPSMPFKVPH
jgi:hypothetical protein